MKQSEKLDLILKYIYEFRFDGKYYHIATIAKLQNFQLQNLDEERMLADRLMNEKLVNRQHHHNGSFVQLTTYGIDYCEENSFSIKGHAIITNNYHITHSPNAAIMTHSPKAKIQINNVDEVKRIIDELKTTVIDSALITGQSQIDIMDCLDEINTAVEAKRKPRFALDKLIEMAGSFSEIGHFVLALRETIMK